jgi:WhiB family transcriptional regulator, redox-sensing transcriptional regulator
MQSIGGGLRVVRGGSIDIVIQDWRAFAACAETDPDLWFAAGAIEHKIAKRICRVCPVREQCLAYAMEEPVDHGLWGGLTERERRRYRRQAGQGDWRALIA